jgi:hypothetical protein
LRKIGVPGDYVKLITLILFSVTLFSSCRPEQEAVDFGVTRKPLAGDEASFTTNEDEAVRFNYKMDEDKNAISLELSMHAKPVHGSLSDCQKISALELDCLYTPKKDYFGKDAIWLKTKDGDFVSDGSMQIKIDVLPVSDAPNAAPDQAITIPENTVHQFKLNQAFDIDSSNLDYSITSVSGGGDLVCDTSGNCVFTPLLDYFGKVDITYKAIDEAGLETNSETQLEIKLLNFPEVGTDQNLELTRNFTARLEFNEAIDYDNLGALEYSIVKAPLHGVLENCATLSGVYSCDYHPTNGFEGADALQYKIIDSDGLESINTATVNINVLKANLPPRVGIDIKVNTDQGTLVNFEVSKGTDPDHVIVTVEAPLTYHIKDLPKNGTVAANCFNSNTLRSRNCGYTPNDGFYGEDSFTYFVKDPFNATSISFAKVTINVKKANQAPVAGAGQLFEVAQDANSSFQVTLASDPDHLDPNTEPALIYTLSTTPKNGNLTNCIGALRVRTCIYIPNAGFYGDDYFEYFVVDTKGLKSNNIARVSFKVVKENALPVVGANQLMTIEQDTPINFLVSVGTDPDHIDPNTEAKLKYVVTTPPKFGILSNCFGDYLIRSCVYTPTAGYYGPDNFSYQVMDERGSKSIAFAKVDFLIEKVNAAPSVGGNQLFNLLQDNPVAFSVNPGTDPEHLDPNIEASLYYVVATLPVSGVLENCFGVDRVRTCTYKPNLGFYGIDTFTYYIIDPQGKKSKTLATVTFDVEKKNLPPVVGANQTFNIIVNNSINITVTTATDPDNLNPAVEAALIYTVIDQPTNGILSGCFGAATVKTCLYTPVTNYYGNDTFTYNVMDAKGLNSIGKATVTIIVEKENEAPVIGSNQSVTVAQDTAKVITVNVGTDPDHVVAGDAPLYYEVVIPPTNGVLSNCFGALKSRACIYKPNAGYYGADSFTYRIKDEKGLYSTANAKVFITVTRKNDAPTVGANQLINFNYATPVTFQVSAGADDITLPANLIYTKQGATSGTITNCFSGAGNRFCTYVPAIGSIADDTFTYNIRDEGNKYSTIATVSLKMNKIEKAGTEIFSQSEKLAGADIVWVIDNSGSMSNDQSRLKNNFASFIQKFVINGKAKFQFNMAVTTTEAYQGGIKAKFETDQQGVQYNLSSVAAEADFGKFTDDFSLAASVGTNGSASEKAFSSAKESRDSNSPWFKGNDTLGVYIIVSDEREQSSPQSAIDWFGILHGYKDNPGKTKIYPIIGDDSDKRYETMAQYSGAVVSDINQSFDSLLDNIATSITSLLDSFILKGNRYILIPSIEVFVNDVKTTAFTYSNNAVKLNTPPPENAIIKITYKYYGP